MPLFQKGDPRAREAGRAGGQSRAQQFTSESQSYARSHVSRESLRENGRNGYAAVCEKHPGFQRAASRRWNLANPSDLERKMMALLDEVRNIWDFADDYKREEEIVSGDLYARVDFCWPAESLIVEVYGNVHFLGGSRQQERDLAKVTWLRSLGWKVLVVYQVDFQDLRGLTLRVSRFLAGREE